jgi:hypothetical protein
MLVRTVWICALTGRADKTTRPNAQRKARAVKRVRWNIHELLYLVFADGDLDPTVEQKREHVSVDYRWSYMVLEAADDG